MADANEEKAPLVYGIDESLNDGTLDSLIFDAGELTIGGLGDAFMTITGFSMRPGGVEKERKNADGTPGEKYITPDQLEVSMRVDNWEELGVSSNETKQWISMPKLVNIGGRPQRAKMTRTSAWGLWMMAWEALGVSQNVQMAHQVHITGGLNDFVGLSFHRQTRQFEGANNSTYPVAIPIELFGYDNELRTSLGLDPKLTAAQRSQAENEAQATPADAAAVPSRVRRETAAATA